MIPIYNFADLSPDQILNRDIQAEADVSTAVDEILSGVREGGDEALRAYTRRFDGAEIPDLEVSPQEIKAAWSSLDPDFRSTLELAAENIRHFHSQQVHRDFVVADRPGIVMGQRYTPIQRVGVCVPRSPEAFPSTILMNVIPARIAGVSEIYVVTPPRPDGSVSAEALAAAYIAGGHPGLPRGRRPGGGSPGLRHGDDSPGGQNCRPRRHLCRHRQAQGFSAGWPST